MTILMSPVDLARLGRSTAQRDIADGHDAETIHQIRTANTPRVRALYLSSLWQRTDYRCRRIFLLSYLRTVKVCAESIETNINTHY